MYESLLAQAPVSMLLLHIIEKTFAKLNFENFVLQKYLAYGSIHKYILLKVRIPHFTILCCSETTSNFIEVLCLIVLYWVGNYITNGYSST